MNITIIGSGYVGLVTGASLAGGGHRVTCVDVNTTRIECLRKGSSPIWEPGLDHLLQENIAKQRLSFTTDLAEAINGTEAVFLAVGTPQNPDGSADISQLINAARSIGSHAQHQFLVIVKSTVPVGTCQQVSTIINNQLDERRAGFTIPVASNPEFLKEGSAIRDFKYGERIIIGVENRDDEAILRNIYDPFNRKSDKIICMDVRSAELTKYAANAMLATRISFMNEIAAIAEQAGADIDAIRLGIGTDPRIGPEFLYAGIGYGGSCFPKDVRALAHIAQSLGCDNSMLRATDKINNAQKSVMFSKLQQLQEAQEPEQRREFHNIHRIAVWGLAFKPKTDDVREAPSLNLVRDLLGAGYEVCAYDPVATDSFSAAVGVDSDTLTFADSPIEAARGADALMICTEWEEFRVFDATSLAAVMNHKTIIDGRNLYNPTHVAEAGFIYSSIGRATAWPAVEAKDQKG